MIKSQSHADIRGFSVSRGTQRRAFIWRMAMVAAGTTIPSLVWGGGDSPKPALTRDPEILSRDEWDAFAAIHEILLPSEPHAPGAKEINATAYLQWVIGDPHLDADHRQLLKEGLTDLDKAARKKWKRPFLKLNPQQRAKLIVHIESKALGQYWLSELLFHLFEAMLGDPIYGGNLDGVGWKWLGHAPGMPRPKQGYGELIEPFR